MVVSPSSRSDDYDEEDYGDEEADDFEEDKKDETFEDDEADGGGEGNGEDGGEGNGEDGYSDQGTFEEPSSTLPAMDSKYSSDVNPEAEGDDNEEGDTYQEDEGDDDYEDDDEAAGEQSFKASSPETSPQAEQPSPKAQKSSPKADLQPAKEEEEEEEQDDQDYDAYDDGGAQFGATTGSMGYTQDFQDEDEEQAPSSPAKRKDVSFGEEQELHKATPADEEFANDVTVAAQEDDYDDDAGFEAAGDTRQSFDQPSNHSFGEEAVTTQRIDEAAETQQEEEQPDEWDDQDVADAILLFKTGDFNRAAALARSAASSCKYRAEGIMQNSAHLTKDRASNRPFSRPASAASNLNQEDAWRGAMDLLAAAHEDSNDAQRAEALYLRMLAWREASEQYETGNFAVAAMLFEKSPNYRSVEDATWFLQTLRPDDGHAAMEAVGLLALGEEVAAKAAVAVWTLALRQNQREKLAEVGGVELLAKAVAFHAENAELQAAGCGALRLLCTGNRLAGRNRRQLIGHLHGAESICQAMRTHPDDPEVLREACGALRAAASKNPAGARRIIENEGFNLCLQAIDSGDEAVGSMACKALSAFKCAAQVGFKSNEAQAENLEAVWEAKLRSEIEAALVSCDEKMREFLGVGDRVVLQSLLGAVSIFVEDGNVRHKALPLVEPVIACMQMFPGLDKVQAPGCCILWSLTIGGEVGPSRERGVVQVASCGGMGPLCQAMRDLPCHAQLQRMAAGAIRNMCYGNDRNKTLAVRAGSIPAIVTAMQRFTKDADLQEQSIGALTSLCDTVGRASVASRLGGIHAIIGALKRHGQAGHLAELGCILLCMLCDDEQLRKQIQDAGAMSVAKALSRSSNNEAQKWGIELLRGLQDV
eukprot:CAMPEP_0197657502 /NCGR_PEP_ID=MMETSP1338-20131121/44669_1 /TAXON_ID=43686 ORGANISM="Pelagodinium beii, Strain RCC1491" /NCGR_SAMPLE_ID=MMETSP1338 /ASSEMBLY_ACC=CAM_ASM_000754 /LENGTH=874 /DNA_ID=CAMNT_0043233893 /DNA_START=58 /DNA_END=2682 /DNA_ORIENTATION=-